MGTSSIFDKRLIFVTGKGGVGKTTVAAALGLAAARAGKRTIVCEVAHQERMSQAFRREGVGYSEAELAPRLFAISIDPQRSMEEYLSSQVKPAPLYKLLFDNRFFQYFAAATPGMRELVTIGKIWELAQLERRSAKASPYDLVIVDAPSTGHGLGILRTPATFRDAARVGPIRRQANIIDSFISDPKLTGVVTVALPEEMLGNEARQVDAERFAEHGLEMRGELWAMMLDAKRTFDELIERHAADERTRDAVLSNRIYQELSNAVAGSQEYMAMEKLYELHQEARYDLLVLDTPPTRQALDFLEAPERMTRFIEGKSLQFFLKPGRLGIRALGRSGGMLFSALKRITGIDLLQDLSEFFQSFGDMAEGFSERAKRVKEVLGNRRTTFLLVTAPEGDPIDEAIFFWRRLKDAKLPFGGVVVNKVHPDYVQMDNSAAGQEPATGWPKDLVLRE